MTGADKPAPYAPVPFAVATGIPISLSSNNVCSAVDDAGSSPSSYTVADNTPYRPSLKLWTGTVILTSTNDTVNNGGGNPTTYSTDQLPRGTIVSAAGAKEPHYLKGPGIVGRLNDLGVVPVSVLGVASWANDPAKAALNFIHFDAGSRNGFPILLSKA